MSSPEDKKPLKIKTAWDHLRTIQRAKETVDSWPEWKKGRIVFRHRSAVESQQNTEGSPEVPRKRSA